MPKRNGHKECVRGPRAIGCVPSMPRSDARRLSRAERRRTSRVAYERQSTLRALTVTPTLVSARVTTRRSTDSCDRQCFTPTARHSPPLSELSILLSTFFFVFWLSDSRRDLRQFLIIIIIIIFVLPWEVTSNIHMVQVLEVVRSNPFDLSNSVSRPLSLLHPRTSGAL